MEKYNKQYNDQQDRKMKRASWLDESVSHKTSRNMDIFKDFSRASIHVVLSTFSCVASTLTSTCSSLLLLSCR